MDRLSIFAQGMEIYQNTGEGMLGAYKDLWRSEEDRKKRQEFGLANENVRKLMSKDDSGDKTTKTDGILDLTVANLFDRMKIPLGKILTDHGPYAHYKMFDFEYRITLPKSEKIMKAQSGQEKGKYKLTDLRLEYETIESEELFREVKDKYNMGRSLGYDYTTLLKTMSWDKDSTFEMIDVNIPRKSMKAIVLLFTEDDADDSEHFSFPNLTKIKVTVEGNPNDLYSEGLKKRNMYDEARRFFGNGLGTSFVSLEKFYVDKFACVLDFRTVDDEKVSGSGRNLIGNFVRNRKRSDLEKFMLPRFRGCRRNDRHRGKQTSKIKKLKRFLKNFFRISFPKKILIQNEMLNPPFHMLIVGMTACGKTHYLLKMIEENFKGKFDNIFFVCPTFLNNKTYSDWKFLKDPEVLAIP